MQHSNLMSIYTCEICDYCTGYKNDYGRHMVSKKHIDRKNGAVVSEYQCETCEYTTESKYLYKKHMDSMKHKKKCVEVTRDIGPTQCEYCLKEYANKRSLWRHKQQCKPSEITSPRMESISSTNSNTTAVPDALLNIVKVHAEMMNQQQQQMTNILATVVEKIGPTTNNSINTNTNTNTINSNNKTFNINFYLNEHCKNAIDIEDFVKNLNCSTSNLEEYPHLSYPDRISKQIKDGMGNYAIEERPIHCSDTKRSKLHIKHNGEWISEKDATKRMQEVIFTIGCMNEDAFRQWVSENPSSMTLDTPAYELYMLIYQNILGPSSDNQEERYTNKIIKAVTEETMIDKEKYAI